VFQFGDIMDMNNLLPSELDFVKNHISSGEFVNECRDGEFAEEWQKHFERYRGLVLPFSAKLLHVPLDHRIAP
jgi:hypothetical protein